MPPDHHDWSLCETRPTPGLSVDLSVCASSHVRKNPDPPPYPRISTTSCNQSDAPYIAWFGVEMQDVLGITQGMEIPGARLLTKVDIGAAT